MQTCTKCKESKPLSEFKFRKDQNKNATRCKSCDSLWTKSHFFGVTFEELLHFMDQHSHACSICGISEKDAKSQNRQTKHYGLYIDHCHSKGHLRGLLCHNCNLVIGHAKDNVETLHKAIKYLET